MSIEPYVELEQKFGVWPGCNREHTVAVASGTAALHVGLEALCLPPGSGVIVPEFTMIACPRAVTMAGLKVFPIDVDNQLLLDRQRLLEIDAHFIRHNDIRAVMPVHIYGRACNMEVIAEWATRNGVYIIEDLAEAHGIEPHPATDVACWSFYRNKIIAGEEGGMIAFKDQDHADYARKIRSHGFNSSHDFHHVPRGVNARLSNAHASLILKSLETFSENLARRRDIQQTYDCLISKEFRPAVRATIPWVYDLRLKPEKYVMASIVDQLNEQGIQARQGFKPISDQMEYFKDYRHKLNAFRLAQQVMYLPINPRQLDCGVAKNCAEFERACNAWRV